MLQPPPRTWEMSMRICANGRSSAPRRPLLAPPVPQGKQAHQALMAQLARLDLLEELVPPESLGPQEVTQDLQGQQELGLQALKDQWAPSA